MLFVCMALLTNLQYCGTVDRSHVGDIHFVEKE